MNNPARAQKILFIVSGMALIVVAFLGHRVSSESVETSYEFHYTVKTPGEVFVGISGSTPASKRSRSEVTVQLTAEVPGVVIIDRPSRLADLPDILADLISADSPGTQTTCYGAELGPHPFGVVSLLADRGGLTDSVTFLVALDSEVCWVLPLRVVPPHGGASYLAACVPAGTVSVEGPWWNRRVTKIFRTLCELKEWNRESTWFEVQGASKWRGPIQAQESR